MGSLIALAAIAVLLIVTTPEPGIFAVIARWLR